MRFEARYRSLEITSLFLCLVILCVFKPRPNILAIFLMPFDEAFVFASYRSMGFHFAFHAVAVVVGRSSIDACRHRISLALVFIPTKFINANDILAPMDSVKNENDLLFLSCCFFFLSSLSQFEMQMN